jgi:two-component system chemotaxis response regulator CheY
MKILVVDDSKAMRMIVVRTVKQAGFESHAFEEAVNGAEGLRAILQGKPGLVLSDWNMPEMTGIEMLQKLRAGGDMTPVGFVTSEASGEMKKLAADSGAAFFVTKPFTADAMREALGQLIKA